MAEDTWLAAQLKRANDRLVENTLRQMTRSERQRETLRLEGLADSLETALRAIGEVRSYAEKLADDSCSCDFGHSEVNAVCPRNGANVPAGRQLLAILAAMDV